MRRRDLLMGAAASLALGRRAWALGEVSEVDIAELMLPSGTTSSPEAWTGLLYELIQTTSVEAIPRSVAISLDDPALFTHPISVLSGNGPLPAISERAVEQLGRYLSYGGFLIINDATGLPQSPFDQSVRALVKGFSLTALFRFCPPPIRSIARSSSSLNPVAVLPSTGSWKE